MVTNSPRSKWLVLRNLYDEERTTNRSLRVYDYVSDSMVYGQSNGWTIRWDLVPNNPWS